MTYDRYIYDRCHVNMHTKGACMGLAAITEVLGGEEVLQQPIRHRLDLLTLSHKGIPKKALLCLAAFLASPVHDFATLLPVSERTLQRYTAQQPLNRVVSEHLVHLAEVAARGVEVFGDKDAFRAWLHQPNTALGSRTPLSVLDSRFGIEMVLEELGRLEHGIVA
jgi:putative toxin-antitoxin system antitoxin component (TIGR02293 family)